MSAVERRPSTSGLEGPPVPAGHAYISEVFSGIQGEGPYVGVRQVFVRLAGCDLRCWWCDTPASLIRRGPAVWETLPGSREFIEVANPIPIYDAASRIAALEPASHHSVTFTGGEPLLQPEAVRQLSDAVHDAGGLTWLETHGGRVRELEEVIGAIDFVSMDFKLPSSAGDSVPLDVHERFLRVARASDVFAKVVVTPETLDSEVEDVASLVAAVDPGIVLVLQQVTPFGRVKETPSPEQMLRLQTLCSRAHPNTRVIPQTHKLTGQR